MNSMIGSYLMFDGRCAEALAVYERALGAKVMEMQKYGDMPPNPAFPIAEQDKGLVLHAKLQVESSEIMCADSTERTTPGDNMYVTITTPDEAMVRKAWTTLAEGGEVYMALEPSFFAKLHGSLRDRFGVNWMFTALN
ncbi:MAG TPA: VOC family protein [Clostridia bacterium]|nr:VOC family protein [Clostridia bacterium]